MQPFKQCLSIAGITDIKYSTTGDLIAASTADGIVFIFKNDEKDFTIIRRFEELTFINQITWVRNELKLLAACKDGSIIFLDLESGATEELYRPPDENKSSAICIASSPRVFMIAGHGDGTVTVLMRKGLQPYSFKAHGAPITSIHLPQAEELILTTGMDGLLRGWNVNPPAYAPVKHTCQFSILVSKSPITYAQVLDPTNMIAVGLTTNTIAMYKFDYSSIKLAPSYYKTEYVTNGAPSAFCFLSSPAHEKFRFVAYQNDQGQGIVHDINGKRNLYKIILAPCFGHAVAAHPIKTQLAFGGGPGDGNLIVFSPQLEQAPPKSPAPPQDSPQEQLQHQMQNPNYNPQNYFAYPQVMGQYAFPMVNGQIMMPMNQQMIPQNGFPPQNDQQQIK